MLRVVAVVAVAPTLRVQQQVRLAVVRLGSHAARAAVGAQLVNE